MSYAVHARSSYAGTSSMRDGRWENGEPDHNCHHPRFPHDWPRELGLSIPGDLDWQAEGLCTKVDLDFTEKSSIERRRKQAICGLCPVQEQCLDLAIETVLDLNMNNHEMPGTWAGFSGREIFDMVKGGEYGIPTDGRTVTRRDARGGWKRSGDQGPRGHRQDVDAAADRRGAA